MLEYRIVIKSNIIDAAIEEIGVGVHLWNLPSKEDLEGASSYNYLQWDNINSLTNNIIQSEEIFWFKKLSITTFIYDIESYMGLISQYSYTKNVEICGFPGGGKNSVQCILYYMLFQKTSSLGKCVLCVNVLYS